MISSKSTIIFSLPNLIFTSYFQKIILIYDKSLNILPMACAVRFGKIVEIWSLHMHNSLYSLRNQMFLFNLVILMFFFFFTNYSLQKKRVSVYPRDSKYESQKSRFPESWATQTYRGNSVADEKAKLATQRPQKLCPSTIEICMEKLMRKLQGNMMAIGRRRARN